VKILVTGGAGFIGSHVAEYYAKKSDEVTVFDNLSRAEILGKGIGNPLFNWNYLRDNYRNVKLFEGDVRNFSEVRRASKDADAIIHAAAQVAVTTSLTDPRMDFEVNAIGTFNVLEAARMNDSTVIYCSTNKVYGENVNKLPVEEGVKRYRFAGEKYRKGIPETFPIDLCGHSPYGCSKLAADVYVQDYAYTYGIKTGVFRMSCIYGERQFGVEDQGWLSWFVIATLTEKPITVYGDGKQVRDVLYVADLVGAFNSFLGTNLRNEVFNIGGGYENTLSLLELLDLLQELTGKKPEFTFSGWRPADQKVYISDISKARKKLNWAPKVTPREGVGKLVRWVSENLSIFKFVRKNGKSMTSGKIRII
jgi:CDP-paratose 2-epimerase